MGGNPPFDSLDKIIDGKINPEQKIDSPRLLIPDTKYGLASGAHLYKKIYIYKKCNRWRVLFRTPQQNPQHPSTQATSDDEGIENLLPDNESNLTPLSVKEGEGGGGDTLEPPCFYWPNYQIDALRHHRRHTAIPHVGRTDGSTCEKRANFKHPSVLPPPACRREVWRAG